MQELRLAFVRPGRRPAARWYQGGFLSTHHRPLWRRSRGADTIKEERLGILIAGRREFIMATLSHVHIEPNAEGEPIIAVTRIKVRMIALDRIARGWDAEEIQRHHPDLSLGQIHSALAYYFDQKQEMGRDIADRHERVTRLRAGAGESPGRRKLRERGLLREEP